ncbi:hypothetical protein AVEN_24044-1 [Araneus ventricosus]|uniref:Uncharacterized protein n=1 Tax=Araneus ventricosus TaxID=182803 RepID=A0A4Y2S4M8_ARAVE|nr:hypothetical protein AVEN_114181-1 [Araneus ventricosus]GBN82342.1 hypothetical protein AVEN_24044-1 [Araneus ventricosus]
MLPELASPSKLQEYTRKTYPTTTTTTTTEFDFKKSHKPMSFFPTWPVSLGRDCSSAAVMVEPPLAFPISNPNICEREKAKKKNKDSECCLRVGGRKKNHKVGLAPNLDYGDNSASYRHTKSTATRASSSSRD